MLSSPVCLRVSTRSFAARDSPIDLELRGDLVFTQGVDQPSDVDLARGSCDSRQDARIGGCGYHYQAKPAKQTWS